MHTPYLIHQDGRLIDLTILYSDWDRIKSPAADQIVPYDKLPEANDPRIMDKLAVLKVNGGLGTSMGEHNTQIVPYNQLIQLDTFIQG